MRDNGPDLASAMLIKRRCRLGQLRISSALLGSSCTTTRTYCSASVGHVIHENGILVLDVTNKDHPSNLVRARALLVDEGKPRVQAIGNRGSTLGATGIGGDDDAVALVEVLSDPAQNRRLGIEVIDGDVEETLDLRGMQVHGDDVILHQRRSARRPGGASHFPPEGSTYAARDLEHIGNQLGADGCPGLVLLVLPGVGEIRDDGSDAAGRCGAAGVDHDEQLHEPVVDVAGGGGLQDEDIFVADGLANGHAGLLVRVVQAQGVGHFDAEAVAKMAAVSLFSTAVLWDCRQTYRLATWALSWGWELPDNSLISFAI